MNQMYHYAHINEDKICYAVTNNFAPLIGSNVIELQPTETNVMGKKYDNGTWVVVDANPEETEPTNQEILNNQYTMMMAIADLYETIAASSTDSTTDSSIDTTNSETIG